MRFGSLGLLGMLSLTPALIGGSAAPASAQSTISADDLMRLQDSILAADREIAEVRARDSSLAWRLESDLEDARDEASYLKVKLRRHEPIGPGEYSSVRDRVESVRGRARGDSRSASAPSPGLPRNPVRPDPADSRAEPPTDRANLDEIPVGAEFEVRLQSSLSSDTSLLEDHFNATTIEDVRDERRRVLMPAGAAIRGMVNSVTKATRTERTGKLTVTFDRVTVDGRSYPIRATVTEAIESDGLRGEAGKIGLGAGAGAIIGALLGGAKGALAGIVIGGGGTIAATEGRDADLPAGTVLRVRMDSPLTLDR